MPFYLCVDRSRVGVNDTMALRCWQNWRLLRQGLPKFLKTKHLSLNRQSENQAAKSSPEKNGVSLSQKASTASAIFLICSASVVFLSCSASQIPPAAKEIRRWTRRGGEDDCDSSGSWLHTEQPVRSSMSPLRSPRLPPPSHDSLFVLLRQWSPLSFRSWILIVHSISE